MNCKKEDLLLYAITDRAWLNGRSLYSQVEECLQGGATFLQLREKTLDEAAFYDEAVELKALCKQYGVPLVINDNVDIAVKMDADGVHVGQSDMKAGNVRSAVGDEMILGVSVHNVEEALEAEKQGADYLGVGAVFPTDTKKDASYVSYDTMKAICDAVSIPVTAIGGIGKENLLNLQGSGADGVALVSAIFSASDIEAECRTLKKLAEQMVGISER